MAGILSDGARVQFSQELNLYNDKGEDAERETERDRERERERERECAWLIQ